MCTAFSYCRIHQQRLRMSGVYAPTILGSFGFGPWAIRPKRLQWLTNIGTGFEIAAFPRHGSAKDVSCRSPYDRHPGESRGPFHRLKWIPAFAGMTALLGERRVTLCTIDVRRALPQIFLSEFWSGAKLRQKHSPPSFHFAQAPP